jgi:hypothetical protein
MLLQVFLMVPDQHWVDGKPVVRRAHALQLAQLAKAVALRDNTV